MGYVQISIVTGKQNGKRNLLTTHTTSIPLGGKSVTFYFPSCHTGLW